MAQIGIRELKTHAADILRRVRDQGESFEITYRGQSFAYLVPVKRATPEGGHDMSQLWADLDALTLEVSARWTQTLTAEEAVRDVRRVL